MLRQRIGIALRDGLSRERKDVRRLASFVLLIVFVGGMGAASAATVLGPVPGRPSPTTGAAAEGTRPALSAVADVAGLAPAVAAEGGAVTLEARGADVGKSASFMSKFHLSEDDIDLLAHLIHAEARGEPYQGQVAVGAVILNRVKSELFPNTVASVIYQPGQYEVVANGQINLTPDPSSLEAAREAAAGEDPTGGALFFFAPAKTSNAFLWSRALKVVIGNHRFTA